MKSAILILNLVMGLLFSGLSTADEVTKSQSQPAKAAEPAPAPEEEAPAPMPVQESAAPEAVPVSAPVQAEALPPAAAPAPKPQAAVAVHKYDRKTIMKLRDSKSLDLRYCLDLDDNAAIAKCAGE